MGIVASETGLPYTQPEVFELEIQEFIERAEDELWWASYHLDVRRKVDPATS
jgi:hypothetical protein